jgi:hypothetical protein
MRAPFRRFALALVAAAAVAAAAACSSSSSQGQDTVRAGASPVAPVPGARSTTLTVPASQNGGALSTPRTLTVTTLLSHLTFPQGLAFARLDGSWVLYVAESDQIDRYPWEAGGISGPRTVIAGDCRISIPAATTYTGRRT